MGRDRKMKIWTNNRSNNVGKLLTRSTRFTYFCTAQIEKNQPKIANIFSRMNNDFPICSFFVSNFYFSANFRWNFVRIWWQIQEKSDVRRFFNRICENKLENCRKFWNLWNLFIIIHYYSFVSLAAALRDLGRGVLLSRTVVVRAVAGQKPAGVLRVAVHGVPRGSNRKDRRQL